LESNARALLEQLPNSGFVWKVLGLSLKMQGKDALQAMQKAAKLLPNDAEAHSNLGNALNELGQFEDAVASFRRALALKPDYAEAHSNLGNALKDLGQFDAAVASYGRALKLKPDLPEVHYNLGNALQALKKSDDAVASYRRALALRPDYADAYSNLGISLQELGQLEDAAASYRKALTFPSEFAEVQHLNLGNTLKELGRLDEATASYRRALKLNPDYADAHYNLGNALKGLGQVDAALASYQRALEIKPDFVSARSGMIVTLSQQGIVLQDLAQLEDAAALFRKVLEIDPEFAEGYSNLGNVQNMLGQLDDAVASYTRALEIKPDLAEAHGSLGSALKGLGQLDEAVASFRRALDLNRDMYKVHDNLLMALQFQSEITAQELFDEHKRFGEQFEVPLKPHWPTHANSRDPDKRLKIGYVSGDFYEHAVAYFIEPVLANHEKTQVEVFCYANRRWEDAVTARLKACADRWVPCADLGDDELAQRIQDDGIDILVDLAGHTSHNRLLTFARKPAPIQITYIGYLGTSGLSAMDYRLTDRYAEAEGAERYHSEELLRLPDSQWCYRPPEDLASASPIAPLPALANRYLTFGSFNNTNKITPDSIVLWASLLRSLPTSRLLIVTSTDLRQSLTQQFEKQGIAAERIDYRDRMKADEFRQALQQVDITLDPYPNNGATTTCESLWQGVPVLNLVGARNLSRNGLSVLSAAGLPEFAAATQEEYIQVATRFANDLPALAAIRAGMRERLKGTPLLDQQRFTRNLENIYRDVWRKYTSA
jgi:predicted O-linked N-acetylglucosamine transferase (SPINDLY family)